MPFRTLDNLDVAGPRVLLRADLYVPVRDGKISDGEGRHGRSGPSVDAIGWFSLHRPRPNETGECPAAVTPRRWERRLKMPHARLAGNEGQHGLRRDVRPAAACASGMIGRWTTVPCPQPADAISVLAKIIAFEQQGISACLCRGVAAQSPIFNCAG